MRGWSGRTIKYSFYLINSRCILFRSVDIKEKYKQKAADPCTLDSLLFVCRIECLSFLHCKKV